MRALGFEPRKEEIKKMVTEVDRADTGRLNFDAFLALMAAKMAEKDSKEEILKVGGNVFFILITSQGSIWGGEIP